MSSLLCETIKSHEAVLAVVGLGYVGLPLAIAFAEKVKTLGFDIDKEKIAVYKSGIDPTREIGDEAISATTLEFTGDPERLLEAKVIIVAVPTPVNGDKTPNLTPVLEASKLVGRYLSAGALVLFESTVYPGVTEDICIPLLEKESGLRCGLDFKVGYSPERINPGDKQNTLRNIRKIVSAVDEESLEATAAVYELVIAAGTYKAPCIKVAEAAKLAENAQRDVNIAFMNELAMVFDRVGISTKEVIAAMNTKWNALGFYPGLVGGHCIGVDPYYFIYQAEILGYHSQISAAGRRVNDMVGEFVTGKIIKKMIQAKLDLTKAAIYIMGVTFKEDCPDMRNSQAVGVYRNLADYGLNVKAVDPVADANLCEKETGVKLVPLELVTDADCLVFLVAHKQFKDWGPDKLKKMFKTQSLIGNRILIDVKSMYNRKRMEEEQYIYWAL